MVCPDFFTYLRLLAIKYVLLATSYLLYLLRTSSLYLDCKLSLEISSV
nr:MAG TPA: hypothetical protein [Caudoviricetes sp.]